jgi:hypothetical protein
MIRDGREGRTHCRLLAPAGQAPLKQADLNPKERQKASTAATVTMRAAAFACTRIRRNRSAVIEGFCIGGRTALASAHLGRGSLRLAAGRGGGRTGCGFRCGTGAGGEAGEPAASLAAMTRLTINRLTHALDDPHQPAWTWISLRLADHDRGSQGGRGGVSGATQAVFPRTLMAINHSRGYPRPVTRDSHKVYYGIFYSDGISDICR